MNDNKNLVRIILDHMLSIVKLHGLDMMRLYPNDLLVHDKRILERVAYPGAKIAWMVGHTHTHIVPLGLNPKENACVEYLTNLASADRFYVITINQDGCYTMEELNRKQFAALSETPVPFATEGDKSSFWLYRNKTKIGHIELKLIGTAEAYRVEAKIRPCDAISGIDMAALHSWCAYATSNLAGTLFVKSDLAVEEPMRFPKAA